MLSIVVTSDGAETDIPQAMSMAYNGAMEVIVVDKQGKEICRATPQLSEPVAEPAPPAEPAPALDSYNVDITLPTPPEPVVDAPPAPPAE